MYHILVLYSTYLGKKREEEWVPNNNFFQYHHQTSRRLVLCQWSVAAVFLCSYRMVQYLKE